MTSPTAVSAETVLSLLNSEIEAATAEQSRSGWTLWALAGTLAAASIFLLDLMARGNLGVPNVSKWILVIALPVDAILMWLQDWSTRETRRRTHTYRSNRESKGEQIAYLWRTITTASLAALAVLSADGVWWPAVYVSAGWFGFLAVVYLLVFIAIFMDAHYKEPDQSPAAIATMLVLLLAASSCYARSLLPLTDSWTAEFQAAGAVLVIVYVLHRLMMRLRKPWVVERLTLIRRELALGRIDVPRAVRSAEAVLMGMEAHTALEEDLRRTRELHDDMQDDLARLQIKLQNTEEKLAQAEQSMLISASAAGNLDDELAALRDLTRIVLKSKKRINARTSQLNRAAEKIRDEAPVSYARGYEAFRDGYNDLVARNASLDELLSNLEASSVEVRTRWDTIRSRNEERRKLLREHKRRAGAKARTNSKSSG